MNDYDKGYANGRNDGQDGRPFHCPNTPGIFPSYFDGYHDGYSAGAQDRRDNLENDHDA